MKRFKIISTEGEYWPKELSINEIVYLVPGYTFHFQEGYTAIVHKESPINSNTRQPYPHYGVPISHIEEINL